jgi:hypothetical protein
MDTNIAIEAESVKRKFADRCVDALLGGVVLISLGGLIYALLGN